MNLRALMLRIALLVLGKLKERSSVYSYVALVTSLVCKHLNSEAGTIAAAISATAGALLFIVSDRQVTAILSGPASSKGSIPLLVTVPQPAAPAASTPHGENTMNLALLLGVMSALPQLFGLVNSTVHEVENVFGTLPGATKYAAATAKVNSILQTAVTDVNTLQAASQAVGPLVNASVAMFNAAGVFPRKPAVQSGEPAPAQA